MDHKFQLGESVLYIRSGVIKKGKVVLYKEELLDGDSIAVIYRVQCEEDGDMNYKDEWEMAKNELDLANNILEEYGFSSDLRFRHVCERCTRTITNEDHDIVMTS